MNILLAGENQETRFLARALKLKKHNVTVVSRSESFCRILADGYEVTSVCGSGTDPGVLTDAGIRKADLVVALEHQDATNLLICEAAKKQFQVPKTIAVVADPQNMEIFRDLGVDRCICTADFLADMIGQAAAGGIRHSEEDK